MKGDERLVSLTQASYRRIHEERRIAKALLASEVEHSEHVRTWAQEAFAEQRRLAKRLEFVYDVAVRHGATREELSSPGIDARESLLAPAQLETPNG